MDIDCHTVEFDDVRYHIQVSSILLHRFASKVVATVPSLGNKWMIYLYHHGGNGLTDFGIDPNQCQILRVANFWRGWFWYKLNS
jgi:hypothetical protein